MGSDATTTEDQLAAQYLPEWDVAELPKPAPFRMDPIRLIGPGMLMAGAAIGGGEWLTGPAITAQFGGVLLWIATLSILFQAIYNLEVMRYTLYCGETIFVAFLRTWPGPKVWAGIYLFLDWGSMLPYLAANAAVPLLAAFAGRMPDAGDARTLQILAYVLFTVAFIPLLFGGRIYYTLEKLMLAKIVLVLGYLLFICAWYVDWRLWVEIFSGFLKFGQLPEVDGRAITWSEVIESTWNPGKCPIDLALVGAMAAVAGVGGLNNTGFSSFAREKGWGMGQQVGGLPSMIGGKGIRLSHIGKRFVVTAETLAFWKRWRGITIRDQFGIWVGGCILGMAIPSLVSIQFTQGQTVSAENIAAITAQGIVAVTGSNVFWFLTLLCGFVVLWPSQVTNVDGFTRRWTDVIWSSNRAARRMAPEQVGRVYYGLILFYYAMGLIFLTLLPNPGVLLKLMGMQINFALGLSAFHCLWANCTLLPGPLRPSWLTRVLMSACGLFFVSIALISLPQTFRDVAAVWSG